MPSDRIYTVAQLTRAVRSLLETRIGEVWVEGEVSNHRLQSSGHQYFTLKDESAQLSCVLFRGNARLSNLRIVDGIQLQVFGDVTVYEARGQYQLIVRAIQSKGAGALQAKFEALKKKLAAEGIFDRETKKPIPEFPHTVALVTSPTGAALRDMLNILGRRAPWVRILVYPVRVQGKGAELEIAEAVAALNRKDAAAFTGAGLPPIDTIVVTRGGGSIEDLWCFNEEIVARAIHASAIPVVSAVGHEIDFTIADFAADFRAPTPSAAAELIVPDQEELRRRLRKLGSIINQEVLATLHHHSRVLDLISRGALSREPQRVLEEYQQQLDHFAGSLHATTSNTVEHFRVRTLNAARILEMSRPDRVLDRRRQQFTLLGQKLATSTRHRIERRADQLRSIAGLLRTLGPEATFSRGFSMTTDEAGNALMDANEVSAGQRIRTRLAKGDFESVVDD